MNKTRLLESNFALWGLICEVSHSILLARQKELSQFEIPVRQYELLRNIQSLGIKATLPNVAKRVQRELHVVSRQAIKMEKDGLIKRSKNKSKSTLLTLELTDKGLDLIKIARDSKSINAIFTFLSDEERQQIDSILRAILTKVNEYNPD